MFNKVKLNKKVIVGILAISLGVSLIANSNTMLCQNDNDSTGQIYVVSRYHVSNTRLGLFLVDEDKMMAYPFRNCEKPNQIVYSRMPKRGGL